MFFSFAGTALAGILGMEVTVMRKFLIACLLPVLAAVVFNAVPVNKKAIGERNSPVQRSLKLCDMEQRQMEIDRAAMKFRAGE